MTRKRRFFIFFASAGAMLLFLLFSLSVRQDDPLKKWSQWLPGNKVKAMILDRENATGDVLAKNIIYSDSAKLSLEKFNISELEVRHGLREAEVVFSHELTAARENPKKYYLEFELLKTAYFAQIAVQQQYSEVLLFGKIPSEK